MDKKPNSLQKLIHRFLMLRYVSALLARILNPADQIILKITRGKHTVAEIVGLPIVQLTTHGAKTGQLRTMPLVAIRDGEMFALIGSNFGQKHNPGWYYNLKANPKCTIKIKGVSRGYLARQTKDAEREKYWQMALSYYKGYDKYKERAFHRVIPVMVLEPME